MRYCSACFATSFPPLCQDENIWFVGQVSWQALAIGESVYVLKVLTETQCAEDHAELPVRGRQGEGRCSGRDGRGADGVGGEEG